ncbi:MAG: DUF2807 domain-containing protein [Bacteroidota bacterium]
MRLYSAFFTLTLLFIAQVSLFAQANTRIDGNGNIQTKTIAIQEFEHFQINTPARVLIEAGKTPSLRITMDENIFDRLNIEETGRTLSIAPEGWIEPTQFDIYVSIPQLGKITTSGYGEYTLEGIAGERLEVENGVGTMEIKGTVEDILIRSRKGEIDASNLVAQKATIYLSSYTTVFVDARQKLEAYPGKKGKVIYTSTPKELAVQLDAPKQLMTRAQYDALPTPPPVQYVNLKLHNNRLAYTSIRIEGPENRPFGYGTSIFPFFKRKERFPVGTKIFQQLNDGSEKLLVEITPTDDDKTVKLF